jgi:hypothetical protein
MLTVCPGACPGVLPGALGGQNTTVNVEVFPQACAVVTLDVNAVEVQPNETKREVGASLVAQDECAGGEEVPDPSEHPVQRGGRVVGGQPMPNRYLGPDFGDVGQPGLGVQVPVGLLRQLVSPSLRRKAEPRRRRIGCIDPPMWSSAMCSIPLRCKVELAAGYERRWETRPGGCRPDGPHGVDDGCVAVGDDELGWRGDVEAGWSLSLSPT